MTLTKKDRELLDLLQRVGGLTRSSPIFPRRSNAPKWVMRRPMAILPGQPVSHTHAWLDKMMLLGLVSESCTSTTVSFRYVYQLTPAGLQAVLGVESQNG